MEGGVERVEAIPHGDGRPAGGPGLNVLLIGSDSRAGLTDDERRRYRLGGEPCHCADTIMLLHLSEDRDRASVISLPRDSRAELAAHTLPGTTERHAPHEAKLNAALSHGGPQLMVRTVERMTGVRVDHYLEVGFVGFMRAVDEIGGVDVCTARPLSDPRSGLDLPAGTSTLNGGQALSYVRAREIDATADFGRIQRQQRFVAALAHRVADAEVLLDPAVLRRTVGHLLDSVRADPGLGVPEMLDIARTLRGVDAGVVEFASVPVGPLGGPALEWDEEAAGRLFTAVREDRPLVPEGEGHRDGGVVPVDIAPQQIRVRVEDAGGREGMAARADRELSATGFLTAGVPEDAPGGSADGEGAGGAGGAGDRHHRTTITHAPDRRAEAAALAAAVPGAHLREDPDAGAELLLTLGEDFDGVRWVRDGRQPVSGAESRPVEKAGTSNAAEESDTADTGIVATRADRIGCA
ncbi:LCP family protein [Streptomyces sp. ST2-7A]|uniref:LCP family protein n=1 Tax=Streptomyces sp. ST2-7A TaxID=2907214 RepID=UPI001F3A0DB1|nr:LCP family protein [Streptomyces sp. ST2-7A]